MSISSSLLLCLNKCFKPPKHPFNLRTSGESTYARWQYEKGGQTLNFYLAYATAAEMFEGKTVLDVGCGAAGKSVYYASLGAEKVVGLDVLEQYREEAVKLADEKGFGDRFEFVCADAANTGFSDGAFDTVIMNDAVEHVARPAETLRECLRMLKPGGKLFLNFPPYYHPYGAHLSDAISVPWVHALFSEKTLIRVYRKLAGRMPDGDERIALRISMKPDGTEYLSFFNRMTVRRFEGLLREIPAKCLYYHEEPLRKFLRPISRLPGFREFFVKMVVAVLEPADADANAAG